MAFYLKNIKKEVVVIDTSKMKCGDYYKDYPTLCKALEIEPKSHNSKKAQLKELARYLLYEECKPRGYKIIEIYPEPLPKEPVPRNRHSNYADWLYPLLINILYKAYKGQVDTGEVLGNHYLISKGALLSELTLTDMSTYYDAIYYCNYYYEYELACDIRKDLGGFICSNLQEILDRFNNKKIIENTLIYNYTYIGEKNNSLEEEKVLQIIRETEQKTLEENGFANNYEAIQENKDKYIKSEINKKLLEYNIHFSGKLFNLTIPDNIEELYSEIRGTKTEKEFDDYLFDNIYKLRLKYWQHMQTSNRKKTSKFEYHNQYLIGDDSTECKIFNHIAKSREMFNPRTNNKLISEIERIYVETREHITKNIIGIYEDDSNYLNI